MSWAWGNISKYRMNGVYPFLAECANLTLEDSKIDLTITWMGGVRNAKQQNDIFKQGNSKCDGYKVLSYHQIEASYTGYGMALDIRPVGWQNMNRKTLNRWQNYIGRLMLTNWQELVFKYAQQGKDIGVMVWGGTFGSTSWDRPHYEIRV